MNRRIVKLLAVVTFVGAASSSAIAKPRTLDSGAPACGNTESKAPSACQRAEQDVFAARRELATALHKERTIRVHGLAQEGPRVTRARKALAKATEDLRRNADKPTADLLGMNR